jgi:hypothetical protein
MSQTDGSGKAAAFPVAEFQLPEFRMKFSTTSLSTSGIVIPFLSSDSWISR